MQIPMNLFMWLIALLPIIVLLVLMIKFQWGATEAAPVGLMITVITGVAFYKANITLLASESAKGIWNALVILVIVWTAILMYQVAEEANAFSVIRKGMGELLPNELLMILAMGWIIESFLQGITGFGVPVAVGAPLLIGIGVSPLWAVIIPLLGQSWGNTFGTLAAAWDSLAMSAGIHVGSAEYFRTAFVAGSFLWIWNLVIGLVICWFYGKGRGIKKGLPAVVILSLIQGGGELLLSQFNTTLACFVPACGGMVAIFLLGRTSWYKEPWKLSDSPIMIRKEIKEEESNVPEGMTLVQAFVPYILLAVITLIVLLCGPINAILGSLKFGFSFPETKTGYGFVNAAVKGYSSFSPFTHASMFLFISSILGLIYYRKCGWISKEGTKAIFIRSVSMTMPSGIAVIGLIIMSKIMGGTGQTLVLAQGISQVLGKGYVVLAPIVGMIGSFMTGSNMSSNILFGNFQMTTASMLGVKASALLGAQTAGASVGSSISPSNIILGTTTANILGSEGEALKRILPISVTMTLLIGVFTMVFLVLI